jgi:lysophospholipase L1-like esterase
VCKTCSMIPNEGNGNERRDWVWESGVGAYSGMASASCFQPVSLNTLIKLMFSKTASKGALLLSCLFLSVLPVRGAIRTAASPSLADVQTAMAGCADGDTLSIPAGSSTWSSTLTITKSITIQGAGTNSTVITRSSGTAIQISPAKPDLLLRITGIQFVLGTGWNTSSTTYSIKVNNCRSLRIDNCLFKYGYVVISIDYQGYGVIDHCTFLDSNQEICPWQNFPSGATSLSWGIRPGTTNTLTVEDCLFYHDSSCSSATRQETVYGQYGARCTFRYNTVKDLSGNGLFNVIDAHGYVGNSSRGTLLYEIYGNTFGPGPSGAWGRLLNLRGGTHLVFSNAFTSSGYFIQLKNEGQSTWNSYDPTDELTNCFFFANTFNGTTPSGQGIQIEGGSEPYVIQGRNYFLHAPNATNNFYPYTPMAYPHPLVSGVSGNTNPIISVSPSSVDITLDKGQTTNITFTVQNIGSNTLSGSASLSVTGPFTISGSGTTYNLAAGAKTNFTLSYVQGVAWSSSATLTLTGGGGASIALLGGLPKVYIECVGDSLTRGGASTGTNLIAGGYRLPLYQLLTNAGVNVVFTGSFSNNSAAGLPYPLHDGVGGATIRDIASAYPGYVSTIQQPDYVLLQVGFNDFRLNDAITTATNRLSALITEVATNWPNARIIVADMNPWDNLATTNDAMNAYYNPFIPGLVATHVAAGRKVYLADMRQPYMTVSDVMPGDNTHFQASGYNKMAAKWMSVISTIISGVNSAEPAPPGNLHFVAGP